MRCCCRPCAAALRSRLASAPAPPFANSNRRRREPQANSAPFFDTAISAKTQRSSGSISGAPSGRIHDGHNFVRSSYGSPPSRARTSQGMGRLLLRPSGTHLLTLCRDVRRWFVCACLLLWWGISTRCDGGPGANVLSFRRKRVRVSTLFDRCGAQPPRRGRANWDTVAQGKPWSTRLPRTSQLRLLACFIYGVRGLLNGGGALRQAARMSHLCGVVSGGGRRSRATRHAKYQCQD